MPEIQECLAQYRLLQKFVEMESKRGPLVVRGFYCDSTEKEDEANKLYRAHVYRLSPESTITRVGSEGDGRGSIIPPAKVLGKRPTKDEDFASLIWLGMRRRVRSLEFTFSDGKSLVVHLLTHTLTQIYTKKQWEESVSKVPKRERGFVVAFAIDFEEWVVAFTSMDGLTVPTWSLSPPDDNCILNNPEKWLAAFLRWLSYVANWSQTDEPLLHFLLTLKDIFTGLGSYTSNDVIGRAGLHPLLKPVEVFGSPSRTARLLLSYADYCVTADAKSTSCLDGCRNGYLVVQDEDHRAKYIGSAFVHGKSQRRLPRIVASIVEHNMAITKEFESRSPSQRFERGPASGLLDVWDANFMVSPPLFDLQDLVLGSTEWKSPFAPTRKELQNLGPLSGFYASLGTLNGPSSTFLGSKPKATEPEATDPKDRVVPIHALSVTSKGIVKTVWTLYTDFHPLSISWAPLRDPAKRITQAALLKAGEHRKYSAIVLTPSLQKSMSPLHNITHGEEFVMGPADYVGAARMVGHGVHTWILICKDDPQVPRAALDKYRHATLVRRARLAADHAALKEAALTELPENSRMAKEAKKHYKSAVSSMNQAEGRRSNSWRSIVDSRLEKDAMQEVARPTDAGEDLEPPKSKRRRVSANAAIAASAQAQSFASGRSTRSRNKDVHV